MLKINEKLKPLFEGKTRYYILTGGRGSSKSFTVSTFLNLLTFEQHHRILFTRWTMISAHISIIPEFLEKIEILNATNHFKITTTDIINTRTGSDIIFRGLKTSQGNQTANLKSLVGITTWVIDEAEEMPDEDTFDKIDLSVRKKGVQNRVIIILNPCHKTHWIYKRFFEKPGIKDQFNGVVGNITYIHTTYLDNYENLDKSFLGVVEDIRRENPNKYKHQIMGGWLSDVDGALWRQKLIDKWRVYELPEMQRIVVAIDPAVTSDKKSDETGIIVAGLGVDNRAYVIEDASDRMSPNEWAKRAIIAYRKHKADRIIGEVNNGGDLIETVIRNLDTAIPYKSVHASRGKAKRAEPVVALYEKGVVSHLGYLGEVEAQMVTWTKEDTWSPDRVDALVWALTELMIGKSNTDYWG